MKASSWDLELRLHGLRDCLLSWIFQVFVAAECGWLLLAFAFVLVMPRTSHNYVS